MDNTIAIGIDLGTTNSVMARIKGKDYRVLENQDNEPLTPSVVYMTEDHEPIVGKLAREYGGSDPENTVLSIKRFMGRDLNDPTIKKDLTHVSYKVTEASNGEAEVMLRGRHYSPAQISSFILSAMKKDAEAATDQEVTHAVITVPAYFGNRQRETTREAGKMAGLTVMRIIPEPTAAALAYGLDNNLEEPKTVLVYDLGGGTFDVTVMLIVAGCFNDMGKTGDMHLGGDDFDHKIMDWMIEQARLEHRIDPAAWQHNSQIMFTLKNHAEATKIKLSRTTRTGIAIPSITTVNGRPLSLNYELTREQLNGMLRPLIDRSIDLVHEAIQKANATVDEIDAILLVGGSTRYPLVEDRLREIFGAKVVRSNVNPMHCVAQGAAIQTLIPPEEVPETTAAPSRPVEIYEKSQEPQRLPDKECPQCEKTNPGTAKVCIFCGASLTMGVEDVQQKIPVPIGLQLEGDKMAVMLDDTMYYPTHTPVTNIFHTSRPGQEKVYIPVYEGWDPTASKNQFLGEAQGELPAGLVENTSVSVSISIDADGILYVTASLPDRPSVKIEAAMAWKKRTSEQPKNGKDGNGGGGGGGLSDWHMDAQGALGRGGLVIREADGFLPDAMISPMRVTGQQLLQAIEVNDEVNGKALQKKMEEHVDQLFVFMVLGIGRNIAQDPDIAMKIGLQKADALSQAVARADRYKNAKDVDNMVKAINVDVMQALEPILAILNEGGGGDNIKNLLRGSSSTSFNK